MANHLIFYSLVGPGDHVICHYPTYQQLFDTPRSLGAEVHLWKTSPERDWSLDIDDLEKMIKDNTKLIVIK
jgi:aspartate/methionine/tyrosine aminotransferase